MFEFLPFTSLITHYQTDKSMKKSILLLSALLMISILSFSQKISVDKVPDAVKKSFTAKFPAATEASYEMEKNDYEINFKEKGTEKSANFDVAGKWLETETAIKESELPAEVTASIAKFFAGYTVTETDKTETPARGLFYEVELTKDKKGVEVQFTEKGDILKQTLLKAEK